MGAKIQACYNALPVNGGVCDCTDAPMQGAQQAASAIICNKENAVVLLGSTGLTLHGGPWKLAANGCGIVGANKYQSWILTSSAIADVLQSVAEKQVIEHIGLASAPGVVRTAGAGINVGVGAKSFSGPGDALRIDDITVFRTWHGVWASGGSASGAWTNISCLPNQVPNYVANGNTFALGSGANDCLQLGPIHNGNITGTSVTGLVANDNYNDAAIVVDSGTDSESFSQLNIGGPISGSMTAIHVKNSLGSFFAPSSIFFAGGDVEGSRSGSGMVLDACGHCIISNITIQGGARNVVIGAGVYDLSLNNSIIASADNECILLAGGLHGSVQIIGDKIGSCSLSSDSGFPSIRIGQAATGIVISNNHFFPYIGCGASGCKKKPSSNIQLDGGTARQPESDLIVITGNIFGDYNRKAVVNNSKGTNIVITGNVEAK